MAAGGSPGARDAEERSPAARWPPRTRFLGKRVRAPEGPSPSGPPPRPLPFLRRPPTVARFLGPSPGSPRAHAAMLGPASAPAALPPEPACARARSPPRARLPRRLPPLRRLRCPAALAPFPQPSRAALGAPSPSAFLLPLSRARRGVLGPASPPWIQAHRARKGVTAFPSFSSGLRILCLLPPKDEQCQNLFPFSSVSSTVRKCLVLKQPVCLALLPPSECGSGMCKLMLQQELDQVSSTLFVKQAGSLSQTQKQHFL